MIDRNQIISEIAESFYNFMIKVDENTYFEIDNPKLIKKHMGFFFTKKAERLSDEELLTAFDDSSMLLDDFIDYLKAQLVKFGKSTH